MGYHPVAVEEMDKCTGCAICARFVPIVSLQFTNRGS